MPLPPLTSTLTSLPVLQEEALMEEISKLEQEMSRLENDPDRKIKVVVSTSDIS